MNHRASRCQAAHPDDATGCCGPTDAVRVVDHTGAQATGCVHHAAAMLASITGARVYPGSVTGAAVVAHQLAARRQPFDFHTPAPALEPDGHLAAAVGSGGRVVLLLGDEQALTVQANRNGLRLGLRDHARVVEVDLPPAHAAALADMLASTRPPATFGAGHPHGAATTTAEPNPAEGSDATTGGQQAGTP